MQALPRGWTAMTLKWMGRRNDSSNSRSLNIISSEVSSCSWVVLPHARKMKLPGETWIPKNTCLFQNSISFLFSISQLMTFKGILHFILITSIDCQNNYSGLYLNLDWKTFEKNKPYYETLWQIDWCTSHNSQKSILVGWQILAPIGFM